MKRFVMIFIQKYTPKRFISGNQNLIFCFEKDKRENELCDEPKKINALLPAKNHPIQLIFFSCLH